MTTKAKNRLATDVPQGYGTTSEVGRYLGARTRKTAGRWVAELRARGLRPVILAGVERFRFSDVDKIVAKGKGL